MAITEANRFRLAEVDLAKLKPRFTVGRKVSRGNVDKKSRQLLGNA